MSDYNVDEPEDEYMADEYDMDILEDDVNPDFDGIDIGVEDFDQWTKAEDTSAAQARDGKDIQGIPWERLSVTRQKYRKTRLDQYKNYENIPDSGESAAKNCTNTEKGSSFYTFRRNSRSVRSTILHFQLRNLVWATSKHDVYLLSNYSISHWSSLTGSRNEILNVKGHVAPSERHPESLLEGFTETQVSTLAVKERLLVAGGFQGELICKHLDRPGVSFCSRTTYMENAITNAIDIYRNSRYLFAFHIILVVSNFRRVIRLDKQKPKLFIWSLLAEHYVSWPQIMTVELETLTWRDISLSNSSVISGLSTSLSPDGKLVAVVGDDPNGLLVDSSNGQTIGTLRGHVDYSFASAWHPNGVTFATGNQDKTCRIWDTRKTSESVAVLKGNLGSVRSIRFTSDGWYIAMAEPADFVHIYDTTTGYKKEQEIDFFGEISGISFSPDTESLFIGVWDRTYGSLLEYGRTRDYSYLDSLLR
ncbi:hypothetical protein HID58_087964 [Brassica napus]|uniref:Transducin/WD40 repeat-like superfamily protein n=1 Tax=Brassica napus TaxID=3708 RepID=A0ABQ7XUT8_BRANA|nr:hypothetical protein HID58_087964 [Brassica napus]